MLKGPDSSFMRLGVCFPAFIVRIRIVTVKRGVPTFLSICLACFFSRGVGCRYPQIFSFSFLRYRLLWWERFLQ